MASEARREFSVAFYGLPLVHRIRELKTDKIGQLISMSGTVTRTTEVRPELVYATFTCNECGRVYHDVEQQFKYTEVSRRRCLIHSFVLSNIMLTLAHLAYRMS